jgi:sporulation protein YlmC with PRC-barrel domain
MIDEGHAIHYTAVERGTPVFGSDAVRIGTVYQVVDNYREHILDGIVIDTEQGERLFVDGPEVARTAERAVTLAFPSGEAAEHLAEPESAAGVFDPNRAAGRLARLFGGHWRRR